MLTRNLPELVPENMDYFTAKLVTKTIFIACFILTCVASTGAYFISTVNLAFLASAMAYNSNNNISKSISNSFQGYNGLIMINFDDGYKSQYTYAKPTLDKYGFKATFFIVCNFIGSGNTHMNWQDVSALHREGYDIQSHTMNHKDLTKLSTQNLEFEIGQSKQCLKDHGINATVFGTPQGKGQDNATVIDTIAKYYDFAKSGFSSVTYLHCDGWGHHSSQTDCRTYFDNGTLTYANRYSMREWSHRHIDSCCLYDNSQMLQKFISEVNTQNKYNNNKNGTVINVIPIITYHNIITSPDVKYSKEASATTINLLDAEIKYLHDNGFKVITMSQIGYDEKNNYMYIKN